MWVSPCCSHSRLSTLSQPFRQSCTSRLCHCGCAMQNLGQDACKVLEGVSKSQIHDGQEDFLGGIAYFVSGAITSKIKASAGTAMQTQTSTNIFCRESPPGTALQQHKQRHTEARPNPKAPIPPENKALHSRLWACRQPCPEPLPQRRTMRQCKPMSNTAPRASCSQGYHGPCTARCNPQRYLLGYPHPFLRERDLPYYPKSQGDGTSGNHSQCIRHRQLLGTGMVSPTYAYAAPSSHQGAVDNYRNMRDKRIHA